MLIEYVWMQESMSEKDAVMWEHGENLFPRFKCKYCLKTYRGCCDVGAWGATMLKEHLMGKSENIARWTRCPMYVRNYFLQELERVRERKKVINEESLHRVESMVPIPEDEDEELHKVLEVSRHEAKFRRREGDRYEHCDGSEGGGGGGCGIRGILRRATSHRERLSDFDVTRAKTLVQTRIDTDPWTSKGKSAKEAIGHAWSKWFHVLGIPDRNVTIHILFQR
jgi:hypothetical protein